MGQRHDDELAEAKKRRRQPWLGERGGGGGGGFKPPQRGDRKRANGERVAAAASNAQVSGDDDAVIGAISIKGHMAFQKRKEMVSDESARPTTYRIAAEHSARQTVVTTTDHVT
ncbi:unnamed protein product [Soboliphyme baturini]|uniref:DUF834 domain-containing protein n=1 Tax=Soboliphyme baturini TaxID=241478 RepID=A0A183ICL5_9BILA|nr:unnamed protein product [Soboliphyme baturini]